MTRSPGLVLVTGASGFVGSHLVDLLRGDGVDVVGWRRPGAVGLAEPRPDVRFVDVEMLDAAAVRDALAALRPAAVYHLAGAAHVAGSWEHTHETFASNVLATHHLVEGLRVSGQRPRVVVSASAMVYRPQDRPLREDDPLEMTSPYATSKLAQELVAQAAWADHGIPAVVARSFNHIGPRQDPSYVAPSVARQIALIEAGRLEPELKIGNLEARRDLTDVRDTVRAYRALMQAGTPGRVYNVCTGRALVIRDLVDTLVAHARRPVSIIQDPARFRPNDVPYLVGDHARLTADTGWQPEVPLGQTVQDLLAYWRQQVSNPAS